MSLVDEVELEELGRLGAEGVTLGEEFREELQGDCHVVTEHLGLHAVVAAQVADVAVDAVRAVPLDAFERCREPKASVDDDERAGVVTLAERDAGGVELGLATTRTELAPHAAGVEDAEDFVVGRHASRDLDLVDEVCDERLVTSALPRGCELHSRGLCHESSFRIICV